MMRSLFYYESEENTMEELIMMKIAIMENAAEELKNFKMGVNEKSPCWLVLARKAKYEFMHRVFLELPNVIFDEEESEAILEQGGFLEFCWEMWTGNEGSIQETMACVAEVMVDAMDGEMDDEMDDEMDEDDEEDCFAVFII